MAASSRSARPARQGDRGTGGRAHGNAIAPGVRPRSEAGQDARRSELGSSPSRARIRRCLLPGSWKGVVVMVFLDVTMGPSGDERHGRARRADGWDSYLISFPKHSPQTILPGPSPLALHCSRRRVQRGCSPDVSRNETSIRPYLHMFALRVRLGVRLGDAPVCGRGPGWLGGDGRGGWMRE